jgi:chitin biosynthesis protein CHS5
VISLSLFRNGQKAGNIPQPTTIQSTKISGLAVDTEYTFHLVLRTTAGTFASERVTVRTHKMTDLSGITITPGILPAQLRESLINAVDRIGAKLADTVRIDTTHFVTTEGRGIAWEKAVEMNIPVVRPEWVEGCERGGRIVGVRQYYLDADPRQRMANLGPVATGQQTTAAELSSSKEEAPLPPIPDNRTSPQANGGSDEASEAGQTHNEKGEDDEDKSEKDDSEDKKLEALDEQKVRVEDHDQHKVALRPVAKSPTDGGEPSVATNPATKSPSSDADADTEEGQKTPGDASFQDVAL